MFLLPFTMIAAMDLKNGLPALGIKADSITSFAYNGDGVLLGVDKALDIDFDDYSKVMGAYAHDDGFIVTETVDFDGDTLDNDQLMGLVRVTEAVESNSSEFATAHIHNTNSQTRAVQYRTTADGIVRTVIQNTMAISCKTADDGSNIWNLRTEDNKVISVNDDGLKKLLDGDTTVYENAQDGIPAGNFIPTSGVMAVWNGETTLTYNLDDNGKYELVGPFDKLFIPAIGEDGKRNSSRAVLVSSNVVETIEDTGAFFGSSPLAPLYVTAIEQPEAPQAK